LGSIYVLEGSTLGGQLIQPHLQQTLGLERGQGSSYFVGYGRQTAAMWQSFRHYVLRHSALDADDAMFRSAALTFQALERWLCDEVR